MRPKKIYLNPKTLDTLSTTSEGVRTMSVRSFPSKTDAEYTDLSQVWHTNKDIPEDGDACLLLILRANDYCEEDEMCFRDYNSLNDPRVAFPIWKDVKMWAYLSDLTTRRTHSILANYY